jgi:hypothetical protein
MAVLRITVVAVDAFGGRSAPATVEVRINEAPVIDAVVVDPPVLTPGGEALVTITAYDPEGDALTYEVTADAGTIEPTAQPNVFRYRAP